MTMTRAQFNSLLVVGLRKVFGDEYNSLPKLYPSIYKVETSTRKYEELRAISGIGMFEQKNEGEPAIYEDRVEGYNKIFTHVSWAKGMRITRELRDDDQYNEMRDLVKYLARAAQYRLEYEHAKLFNYATATTYFTGGDGLALLSASHTLAATPGVTFSNYASSTALSQTAIEKAISAFRRYVNDKNLLINVMPKKLLIPPELEFDAMEILNSTQKAGTPNNEINAVRGRLEIVTWPFLTDTDSWFVLADPGDVPGGLTSFMRTPPEFTSDGDFDTDDLKAKGFMRFSLGFLDPRCVYGSDGA